MQVGTVGCLVDGLEAPITRGCCCHGHRGPSSLCHWLHVRRVTGQGRVLLELLLEGLQVGG